MTLVISLVFSLKQRINSDNERNFRIRWLGRALELINLEEKKFRNKKVQNRSRARRPIINLELLIKKSSEKSSESASGPHDPNN